jgi:hypothetical protein
MPLAIFISFAATLSSIFLVILPGLLILSLAYKKKLLEQQDFSGNFLLASALGLFYSGLKFLIIYKLNLYSNPYAGFSTTLLLDTLLVLTVSLVYKPKKELLTLLNSFKQISFLFFVVLGVYMGVWVVFHHPHVFDSGQLMWTQNFLWSQAGSLSSPLVVYDSYSDPNHLESMVGFTGLIAPLGSLLMKYPLVTVAAGFKVFLLLISLIAAYFIVQKFNHTNRIFYTFFLFSMMLISQFGLYGIIETGKDSIYGVLFCTLFFVTLAQTDEKPRGFELGVFFLAASIMGVISVPYMLLALILWVVFSATHSQLRTSLFPIILINIITLPFVISAMLHKSYLIILFLYLLLIVIIYFVIKSKSVGKYFDSARVYLLPVQNIVPLLFIVAAASLLPANLDLIVWANPDGSLITENRPPLDGATSFITLFSHGSFANKLSVALAFYGFVFMAVSKNIPKSMFPVAAAPFAVIALGLIHVHLHLSMLTDFNLWDLIKDVPQWLGGSFFSVVALLVTINPFSSNDGQGKGLIKIKLFTVAIISSLMFFSAFKCINSIENKPVYYSKIGGSSDKDLVITSQIIWEKLINRELYVSKGILPGYFYSFRNYGARVGEFKDDTLNQDLSKKKIVGFIVFNKYVLSIADYAKKNGASLSYEASLSGNDKSFLTLNFDGKGEISLPNNPYFNGSNAYISDGAYDIESVGGTTFHWVKGTLNLDVPIKNKVACVTLKASAASLDRNVREVSVEGDLKKPFSIDLQGTSLTAPGNYKITLSSESALGGLKFKAKFPEIQFPNDSRKISWAIFTPILVEQGTSCEL